ncbi:MAG: DUF2860 family protein [Pseudomonadales bacterium]
MSVLFAGVLLLITAAFPSFVSAEESDNTEIQTELQSIEEIEQLFAQAMLALDGDDLLTARNRFESILSSNPGLHRARLELARVYYLSLDYQKARQETLLVLEDPNTPPQVRVTLLAFLAQIDADQQELNKAHRWAGSLYLGLSYDTNVNAGPDRDVIDLNGTQLSLTDASLERSDVGFAANLGITHNYSPGKTFELAEHSGFFLWQSQANLNTRTYFSEDEFNLAVLTLRTGPALIVPRHWRAGLALQFDKLWLGNEGLALFTSLNPYIVWQWADDWEFGLDFVYTDRDYDDEFNEPRNGDYLAGSATLSRYFSDSEIGVQAGVGFSSFDAASDRFSHSGPDAFIGINKAMWDDGSVYARLNWRDYDYDGIEPVFNTARDDSELRLTVGFQRLLEWRFLDGWQLLGSWSVTNNSSNVEIFDYDRQLINLGVSRQF